MKQLCTSSRHQLSAHYQGLLQAADGILDQLDWQAAYKLLTGVSYVISEGENSLIDAYFRKLLIWFISFTQKSLYFHSNATIQCQSMFKKNVSQN